MDETRHSLPLANLMAQASAYGLVLLVIILLPILIATSVFKLNVFATR